MVGITWTTEAQRALVDSHLPTYDAAVREGKSAIRRFWDAFNGVYFAKFPEKEGLVEQGTLGSQVLGEGYAMNAAETKIYQKAMESRKKKIKTLFRYLHKKYYNTATDEKTSSTKAVTSAAKAFSTKQRRARNRMEMYYVMHKDYLDPMIAEEMEREDDKKDGAGNDDDEAYDDELEEKESSVSKVNRAEAKSRGWNLRVRHEVIKREFEMASDEDLRAVAEALIQEKEKLRWEANLKESGSALARDPELRKEALERISSFMIANAKTAWEQAAMTTVTIGCAPDPDDPSKLKSRIVAYGLDAGGKIFTDIDPAAAKSLLQPLRVWAKANLFTPERFAHALAEHKAQLPKRGAEAQHFEDGNQGGGVEKQTTVGAGGVGAHADLEDIGESNESLQSSAISAPTRSSETTSLPAVSPIPAAPSPSGTIPETANTTALDSIGQDPVVSDPSSPSVAVDSPSIALQDEGTVKPRPRPRPIKKDGRPEKVALDGAAVIVARKTSSVVVEPDTHIPVVTEPTTLPPVLNLITQNVSGTPLNPYVPIVQQSPIIGLNDPSLTTVTSDVSSIPISRLNPEGGPTEPMEIGLLRGGHLVPSGEGIEHHNPGHGPSHNGSKKGDIEMAGDGVSADADGDGDNTDGEDSDQEDDYSDNSQANPFNGQEFWAQLKTNVPASGTTASKAAPAAPAVGDAVVSVPKKGKKTRKAGPKKRAARKKASPKEVPVEGQPPVVDSDTSANNSQPTTSDPAPALIDAVTDNDTSANNSQPTTNYPAPALIDAVTDAPDAIPDKGAARKRKQDDAPQDDTPPEGGRAKRLRNNVKLPDGTEFVATVRSTRANSGKGIADGKGGAQGKAASIKPKQKGKAGKKSGK